MVKKNPTMKAVQAFYQEDGLSGLQCCYPADVMWGELQSEHAAPLNVFLYCIIIKMSPVLILYCFKKFIKTNNYLYIPVFLHRVFSNTYLACGEIVQNTLTGLIKILTRKNYRTLVIIKQQQICKLIIFKQHISIFVPLTKTRPLRRCLVY